MWKKLLGLGLLAMLLIAALGLAYLYWRSPETAAPSSAKVEATAARLARGKYLFENVAVCIDCHSERDYPRFAGPVVKGREGAGFTFPAELGFPGTVIAPNITPDPETGVGKWSDGEIIRAVREGVDRNGKALFPLMPYTSFRNMSDEDVWSIVVYMRTLKPIKNALPRSRINFPVSLLMKSAPKPVAGQVPQIGRSDPVKYGEYLVSLAGCAECHTPVENGEPVLVRRLAGGQVFHTAIGTVVSPNLTPDTDTGTGKWNEQTFLNKFYQYRKYADLGSPAVGPEGFTVMPWLLYCKMTEDDLRAILAYLKAQPAVSNAVETHPAELQPAHSAIGS